MGLLQDITAPLSQHFHSLGAASQVSVVLGVVLLLAVPLNIASQLLFKNPREPPLVFHWFPFIGSTITYGIDPPAFFQQNRDQVRSTHPWKANAPICVYSQLTDTPRQHGDVFTFILLGKKTTVCIGPQGNDFILNGKIRDVCAEDIYTVLTTPVFGKDVVYDCPNAKLMEQKKVSVSPALLI